MKNKTRSVWALPATAMVVAALAVQFSLAGTAAKSTSGGQALERFKNLAGRWEGTTSSGKKAEVTYEVTAGGTAVLERFAFVGAGGAKAHEMVTLYSLDGGELVLNHYCVANNQPRMKLSNHSADFSRLEFEFAGGGNLADLNQGHMYKAVFEWRDANRYVSAWTFREGQKDKFTETTEFTRVQ